MMFLPKGRELLEAIFMNNAEQVSRIFTSYLSQLTYTHRPEDEVTFNSCIQVILSAFGFDVKGKLHGTEGRMDLYFEIFQQLYLIIAIKHAKKINKLTEAEENLVIADLAFLKLKPAIISQYIAEAVEAKLGPSNVKKLLRESPEEAKTIAKRYKLLANASKEVLSVDERNLAIVKGARENLDKNEIEEALLKAPSKSKPSPEEINDLLKSTVQEAIKGINKLEYQRLIGKDAKKIITLGLTTYDLDSDVLVEFGS
jgi:hypothetical protein